VALPQQSPTAVDAPTKSNPTRRTIRQTFEELRARRRIGLMPFLAAGYPDLETTQAALPALEQAGASLIEIGFPFSDPIADGPTVQEAFTAALSRKLKVADVFGAVRAARASVSFPLVSMVSYSIVFRYGVERFVAAAREAGFDGLILPDLPPPEAQAICEKVWAGGLDTILLIAPTTTPERRREIARLSSGFIYYLSVSGITGERERLPPDLERNLRELRQLTDRPICVGFGISHARHVRELSDLADGAIVGSGVVRRMKQHLNEGPQAIARAVGDYARELLSEVNPPS
jgi:tryptophan synthase alpha chain